MSLHVRPETVQLSHMIFCPCREPDVASAASELAERMSPPARGPPVRPPGGGSCRLLGSPTTQVSAGPFTAQGGAHGGHPALHPLKRSRLGDLKSGGGAGGLDLKPLKRSRHAGSSPRDGSAAAGRSAATGISAAEGAGGSAAVAWGARGVSAGGAASPRAATCERGWPGTPRARSGSAGPASPLARCASDIPLTARSSQSDGASLKAQNRH